MDESFIYSLFVGTGQLVNVKIIRNKNTAVSEGYGFVEFATHEAAEQVLRTFNGWPIPNTDQIFRLNWAAFGVGKVTTDSDFSVFVGDLAPDVTDYALQENFRHFFASVRSAKVITDPLTGRSKGYGFVRFGNEAERDRSLTEMSGHIINSRPIRVSVATAKKSQNSAMASGANSQAHPSDYDPTNTTLFIGGLSSSVTEEDLRVLFGRYGDTVYTKIPPGKGCGFVQFVQRPAAEAAMGQMQGQMLGGSTIRISWGRSSTSRASANAAAAAAAAPAAFGGLFAGTGACAYGTTPFGAGTLPSEYGAAAAFGGAAPTATSDPYSAYYTALAQSDTTALQGIGQQSLADTFPLGNPNSALPNGGTAFQGKLGAAFEPLSPSDVEKLNAAFVTRHQAALLGSHLRA
ncbi:g8894 [Coccomyxa viridis]|uniref:G8894 protein n=1 Tax=Coccomyxa viridis TaxID=1274662 RepID=A0ABP1G1M0_9CHLO